MRRRRTSNVGAEFRNSGRQSVGLNTRVTVVRPPERREVPTEVQFEVARNAVTQTADLVPARLCTGQRQHWEDYFVAQLELAAVGVPKRLIWAFAVASVS